jgi:formylmethanofuran dehydrogenase subunit A
MFATPEYVFKDGTLVARRGRLEAVPTGGTHFVEPDYDPAIEKTLERHYREHMSIDWRHARISKDELCSCSNHGSLLPCKLHGGGRT